MTLQTRVFGYQQQAELNEFLRTAHLYHTDAMPALQFKEEGIVVLYKPGPDTIAPFIAAETIYSHIRHNREALIEDEMKLRQFQWRVDEKKARIAEVEGLMAGIDEEIAALVAPDKEDKEAVKAHKEKRSELVSKRNKLSDELEDRGKDAGLRTQVENAEEDMKVTREKMADRRKDIDMGLQFAADILSGKQEIYRQEHKS